MDLDHLAATRLRCIG